MEKKYVELNSEESLTGTQLLIGKQVLTALFDIITDDNKQGVVLQISINEHNFSLAIERTESND
jgi:hypothetical protein